MSNYLTDLNGVRLAARSLIVRPTAGTRKIVTRMLDGSHSVQQIGSPATKLQVSAIVRAKSELDSICATCAPIRIVHFGTTYTGIISSEEIAWEPVLAGGRWYRGSFEVLVTEGVT